MTNEEKIKHLMHRAGFGMSPLQFKKKCALPLPKVIKELFVMKKKIPQLKVPYHNKVTPQEYRKLSREQKKKERKEIQRLTTVVNLNWLNLMINEDNNPLLEKMTLFWHGHFACESKRYDFAAQQINTIRQHALGNFRDLVLAIAKDASMILYLNNQQNKKSKPNENFARELMELFTLGRGHYTENDIKESARAFTGWFTNRFEGGFSFNAKQHDNGTKTFMGRTGNFNGDDIIDIILEQKQTAIYICQKIYRYFVHEQLNESHIERLSTLFYNSNYDISRLMQAIFESDWFYDDKNVGVRIKSPIELKVGMAKILHLKYETPMSSIFIQRALGQVLFKPPNVAGWPGHKTWIDNATLMLRLNMAAYVINKASLQLNLKTGPEESKIKSPKQMAVSADFKPLHQLLKQVKEDELPTQLMDYLLARPLKTSPAFVTAALANANSEEVLLQLCVDIMSLPEFQLC